MKSLKAHFTVEQLRQMLRLDPTTGQLYWMNRSDAKAGSVRKKTGYINLYVQKKNVLAHRVVWALHFGQWPSGLIDHINGVRSDNRIVNLRLATIAQNAANSGVRANNKLGVKGVHAHNGGFKATIRLNGRNVNLGIHANLEDAAQAYKLASRAAFGEFYLSKDSA